MTDSGEERGTAAPGALHFLDEVPYPLARPAARDLRNLLASALPTSTEIIDVLRATEIPLGDIYLNEPARYVWSDVLVLASRRNPSGGARAFVEKLAGMAADLGVDFLGPRLGAYLAEEPPPSGAPAPIASPPSRVLEQVLGMRSAFVDLVMLPEVVTAARSVVRIAASFSAGPKYGTGFFIGRGRVLTNHHVLFHRGERASALDVWLDYEPTLVGATPAPLSVAADAATIRAEQPDDVGVFELSDPSAGRAPLSFATEPARAEAKVAIVQHPSGLPKQVAFHTVVAEKDGLVHYLTDTEPGSSGSPVLNRTGQVVALHHASVDIKVKGREMPVNEGIAASRVLAALKRLGAKP